METVVLILGITLALCSFLALVAGLRSNLAVIRVSNEANAELVKALVACKAGDGTVQAWLAMNERAPGPTLVEAPEPEMLRNF